MEPNLKEYKNFYKRFTWNKAKKEIAWFPKNKLNAAYNAVDKHLTSWRKNKVALYYEGPEGSRKYTYQELSELSNKFANVLKKLKVKKGDRVFIFLPRIPELYISFLGIIKTGAIAGTLFQAFGPAALEDRLGGSEASIVITDNELKKRIYKVKRKLPQLKKLIIVNSKNLKKNEFSFEKEMNLASHKFNVAKTRADDLAFMLYTSGSTGKPKGVLHSHLACLQEHMTSEWVLDLKEDDLYFCTADPGWVTGISYQILGSLSNGVSELIYNGRFDADEWYKLMEKYKVTVWYTAPTAIRMLMKIGEKTVKKYDLSSLRHMCSVGEPLNPEAIKWGKKAFGLMFHDNWWQTETGSMMISNYRCLKIKPGSMGKPVPGVKAGIVDDNGRELKVNEEGNLAIRPGWPSMFKGVWKNRKKYHSYFVNNWYISGDRARVDKDGYFWFIGRADDVIKTAGERVGPFEVESALLEHRAVAEAGVIGKPDPERGEIIKAFIVLKPKYRESESLKEDISSFVKKRFAGHAYPREISFIKNLPKTKSGKIMRRVLRAQELGLPIGDTSTMEEY
ncbi:acetate--CoA ligase [Candidatus Woesearchaeota archaeon]|nr:acetate--CoA ligase [Candidatus Woesearchaeota archaeon]